MNQNLGKDLSCGADYIWNMGCCSSVVETRLGLPACMFPRALTPISVVLDSEREGTISQKTSPSTEKKSCKSGVYSAQSARA